MVPDGTAVALADQYGPLSALLTLANGDGSQTRINLPGAIGAGYAPDGSWLAAIDGRGALWHVAVPSGAATLLADGPFIGSPIVRADGSVLLLAVPSVAAPISSSLVELDPVSGRIEVLTSDDGETWTILISQPNGSSCLVAVGEGCVKIVSLLAGS